jgi:hypothetical protein
LVSSSFTVNSFSELLFVRDENWRCRWRWSRAFTIAAAQLCSVTVGHANETSSASEGVGDKVAIRVELDAPADCPSADELLDRILTRSTRARVATGDEAARRFRAVIERVGKTFRGRLDSDSLARTDTKNIEANTCTDVLTALALTAALSVDTDAPPSRDTDEPPAPAPPAPAPSAGVTTEPKAAPPPSRSEAAFGASVSALHIGRALFGAHLFGELRSPRPGAWSPGVRLATGYAADVGSGTEPVRLSLLAATVDVCSSRWGQNTYVTPCVRTTAGALSGSSSGLERAETRRLLFGATGVALRGGLSSGSLFLEGDVAVYGVWSAPRYTARPSDRVVASADRSALGATLAAGYRW